MAFTGRQFPDITVKAMNEMGDTIDINVLQIAKAKEKGIGILVPKGFYFCLSN